MERREFLKRAGLVAGAATLGPVLLSACGSSGKSPQAGFDSVIDAAPGDSGIDTIVVVMMENRAFDHYLGWLGTDDEYLEAGKRRYGSGFNVDAKNRLHYRDPRGREIPTEHLVIS